MTTLAGIKLYNSITTPLEIKFEGSSGEMISFLDEKKRIASVGHRSSCH
jgi:hypothetical protein